MTPEQSTERTRAHQWARKVGVSWLASLLLMGPQGLVRRGLPVRLPLRGSGSHTEGQGQTASESSKPGGTGLLPLGLSFPGCNCEEPAGLSHRLRPTLRSCGIRSPLRCHDYRQRTPGPSTENSWWVQALGQSERASWRRPEGSRGDPSWAIPEHRHPQKGVVSSPRHLPAVTHSFLTAVRWAGWAAASGLGFLAVVEMTSVGEFRRGAPILPWLPNILPQLDRMANVPGQTFEDQSLLLWLGGGASSVGLRGNPHTSLL